jgi:lyso-ornithine lipid O-acyltransferase
LPFQIAAVALKMRAARKIPVLYHRLACQIVGLKVHMQGTETTERPLLIVSNHVSWLDISTITSVASVAFIAKREVASWPVFGLLAKLQRSIFVDRERRLRSASTNQEIATRLLDGDAVVLFAEGTSSDGTGVLPFRSALIGAAAQAIDDSAGSARVFLQPLSIVYTGAAGAIVPWHGTMDLIPHFVSVLRAPRLEAQLIWGEPVPYEATTDRKLIAKKLETDVRALRLNALANIA